MAAKDSGDTGRSATKVPLTFACGLYDRVLALYKGEVQPAGIDLEFLVNDVPRNIFDRMAGTQEFDVAELSASEYVSMFDAGRCPFVALPVFTSRVFRPRRRAILQASGLEFRSTP
jgi:4,5-dihydroxyphthalate decarboxylase